MTCAKCASRMFRTNLNYETIGVDNYMVVPDAVFYKCPICGHRHFLTVKGKKKIFLKGQKIKDVPFDV